MTALTDVRLRVARRFASECARFGQQQRFVKERLAPVTYEEWFALDEAYSNALEDREMTANAVIREGGKAGAATAERVASSLRGRAALYPSLHVAAVDIVALLAERDRLTEAVEAARNVSDERAIREVDDAMFEHRLDQLEAALAALDALTGHGEAVVSADSDLPDRLLQDGFLLAEVGLTTGQEFG